MSFLPSLSLNSLVEPSKAQKSMIQNWANIKRLCFEIGFLSEFDWGWKSFHLVQIWRKMPFLCQQWLGFWGSSSQHDIITSVNLTWTRQIRFAYRKRYLSTSFAWTQRQLKNPIMPVWKWDVSILAFFQFPIRHFSNFKVLIWSIYL